MNLRRLIRYLWMGLALLLASSSYGSAAPGFTPEEVKASYIFKLYHFVSLGNPAHSIQHLCYFEKAGIPENESVGQIMSRYVQTHPAEHGSVLTVTRYEAIRDFSTCDVLYIPESEDSNLDNILSAIGTSPVLTISAAKRFIFRGGMIGFVIDDDNRVKMEGNLKNMKANHISMDAQILEIMTQVVGQ